MEVNQINVPVIDGNKFCEAISKKKKSPVVVACDEVHDVHNFGSIMRSALLFGADAVITCENNSAPFSPVAR